jgi:ubiquinone/menaquinone biosynthesis C-methylase UbiE
MNTTAASAKQAEKDYLRRSGSLAWEEVKPFSPAGTQTLGESVRLIHDFAVSTQALELLPGHRVLDLGVGAAWTTEWLRRLNIDAVGVDIAHDMLLVGKSRIPPPALLVTGDFEALPFQVGTFDRAVCLNALHHVPDPAAALCEISRVLNDHGRLVLVEPGSGHSDRETSRVAVEQFGVLERELLATDLMRLCHQAGFQQVVVRPLSYATGEIQLSLDQLARWNRWSQQPRPVRVMRKLWQLVQELAGLSKQNALFEESLGMWVSRVLARHMSEQAVVVAGKGSLTDVAVPYAADLRVLESVAGPSTLTLTVDCRNVGTAMWRARGKHCVLLGVQLLDDSRRTSNRDYARTTLAHDVGPQQHCVVRCEMPRPELGGYLRVELVAEGLTWFDTGAPEGVVVPVRD